MPQPSGIPSYVEQMKLQRKLLTLCQLTLDKIDGLMDNFGQWMNVIFKERKIQLKFSL